VCPTRPCNLLITVCAIGAMAIGAVIAERASGLGPSNVLVLYNADDGPSGEGYQIAQYYQQKRPGVHLVGLTGIDAIYSGTDTTCVSADNYLSVIRPQVLSAIGGISDSIDVIVTTKGLPLKLDAGATPPSGMSSYNWRRYSSLESELTRIDSIDSRFEMGDQFILTGFPAMDTTLGNNPYYNTGAPFNRASPTDGGIRLTSRLDGYSVDTVQAAINRAQKAFIVPLSYGPMIVIDDDPTAGEDQMASTGLGPGPGLKPVADTWQQTAEAVLAQSLNRPGYTFSTPFGRYDNTNDALVTAPGAVIGYVSHGTNDGSGGLATGYIQSQLQFQLANGAVFQSHESYNAASFDPGYSQSQGLIAQWLEIGGTAGLGHVTEPYNGADNVANEDLLYQMLLPAAGGAPGQAGLTFVEAAWNATRQLSYVNTVVGDPLMQFRVWLPGDANLDGSVGSSDYLAWLRGTTGQVDWTHGDFNGDGGIGVADYLIWRGGGQLAGGGALVLTAVPEPSCITMAILALAGLLGLVRGTA
jgi:hypothetical protein